MKNILVIFILMLIQNSNFAAESMMMGGMSGSMSTGGQQAPMRSPTAAPTADDSGFYNQQCPFFDQSAARFKNQIAGLQGYLAGEAETDKKCKTAMGGQDFNNLQLAMGRYRQLMGLDPVSQGSEATAFPGMTGGMGGMSGMGGGGMATDGSRPLTCFNIDQYYKEEAGKFLVKAKSSTAGASSSGGMSGMMGGSGSASAFSTCEGLPAAELEACIAENRVTAVAAAKTNCESNATFQRQKAEMQLKVDTIEKGSTLLKNIILNPDCQASPAIIKGAVSLGAEVASYSIPGLGGVLAGAAGGLIGSLIDAFSPKSPAAKALKGFGEEDHFNNTACLFNSFQNEIYDCKNQESAGYGNTLVKCYDAAMKNPRPMGGIVTDWFQKLADKMDTGEKGPAIDNYFKDVPIGNTTPPITYDSVMDEAKKANCNVKANKSSANEAYETLNKGLQCLSKKNEKQSEGLKSTSDLPPTAEVAPLLAKLTAPNGDLSPEEYSKLFSNNDIIPADLKIKFCPGDANVLAEDEWLITDPLLKAQIKTKYIKLLNCLKSIANYHDNLPAAASFSTYHQVLQQELMFQKQYVQPYDRFISAKYSKKPEVSESVYGKFNSLLTVIKGDAAFENHLKSMSKNAENVLNDNLGSTSRSAFTSTVPFFRACLHMNAMSFLIKDSNASVQSSISEERQDPFGDCDKFKCILPAPNPNTAEGLRVAELQTMACTVSQTPDVYENKLRDRLANLTAEKQKDPSVKKSMDDICKK